MESTSLAKIQSKFRIEITLDISLKQKKHGFGEHMSKQFIFLVSTIYL